MTTKEKIIYEALSQFSVRGYSSVSVRDIAYAVGIKESSLYNHFKNKQDIFDTILSVCQERAMKQYASLNLEDTFKGNLKAYEHIHPDTLHQIAKTMFSFYVSDDYMRMFRKMLTIEQYTNQAVGDLFRDMFIDQAIQFQTYLFRHLMDIGALQKANPEALAIEFYAPIFMLLYRYDKLDGDAERYLGIHIDLFILKNGM